MGKLKIISDRDDVYSVGEVIEVSDFIKSYLECSTTDNGLNDWLVSIPIPSAVEFIAGAWGIDYEFV